MADTTAQIIAQIKSVMDANGIPAYIWMPIAAKESNFNPNATANTSAEHSEGIFQINLMANPQYSKYDLYDVSTNATIAAQNFLAPAYAYAKGQTSNPLQQALIVYSGLKDPSNFNINNSSYIPSGGIKPQWNTTAYNDFTKLFSQYSPTTVIGLPNGSPIIETGNPDGTVSYDSGSGATKNVSPSLSTTSGFVRIGLIAVLIVAGLYAVFQLIKGSNAGNTIIENTKAAAKTTAEIGG